MSLANFSDTLIDYPNSQGYSEEMFKKLAELGVLSGEQVEKYKRHVENVILINEQVMME